MKTTDGNDGIIRAMLLDGQAYAVGVSARHTVQRAMDIHGLSKTTAAALGRIMMAALLCATDVKDETGNVTVTFNGDGLAGRAIAVATPAGTVRATLDNPGADLPIRADGKLDVSGVLGRNGRLRVIRDSGAQPYIGQVRIISGEVAEDLAYYFAMSEQRPCMVFLGVVIDRDQSVKSAGGLAVFPLPECSIQGLEALESRAEAASGLSSMLSKGQSLKDCLKGIFGGMDMKITDEKPASYACTCSRERMEKAMISLGKEELERLIEEDGEAELTCHFCHNTYRFEKPELLAMHKNAGI